MKVAEELKRRLAIWSTILLVLVAIVVAVAFGCWLGQVMRG